MKSDAMTDMPEVAMDVKGLCEIEHDPDDHSREYIPLPGGWEVQTKGRGSSYRLLDKKTGERHGIISGADWRGVQEFFTRFAREVFAASRDEQKQAATALRSLAKELAEARAEGDAMVKERDAAIGLYLGGTMARRAFAAEAASLAKDERIRELEAALEPFASRYVRSDAEDDEPAHITFTVGDIRRAHSTKES